MNPPAIDLSSSHVQHWSDAELFWINWHRRRRPLLSFPTPAIRSDVFENGGGGAGSRVEVIDR